MLTSLLLMVLGPTATVGGLVVLASWLRRERQWREAVERYGLAVETSRLFPFVRLTARSGPVDLQLADGRYGVQVTATVLRARVDLDEVSIRRELLELPGMREIETGDEELDRSFVVKGPEQFVAALLDHPVRQMLRQAVAESASFTIEGNQLRAEVRPDQLDRILPLFLSLGRRFAELEDVPQRLAENVRSDPEPGVRLHCLRLLIETYPGYPCTEEAVRLACRDASPHVRLQAAIALGAEARGVLLELAEGLESDSLSARAVSLLDRSLPLEFLQSILQGALQRQQMETARGCLEALSRHGVGAIETLAEIMARDSSDLAVAAAYALGATGDPAAEAPLLTALARDNPPLQQAAAEALIRVGSVAAVPPLQDLVDGSGPRGLRQAARLAIAEIQERLTGAAPGQLSLAATDAGQLSLATEGGELSLAPHSAGQVPLPPQKAGP